MFDFVQFKNTLSIKANLIKVDKINSADTVGIVSSIIVSTASTVSLSCKHSKSCNLSQIDKVVFTIVLCVSRKANKNV